MVLKQPDIGWNRNLVSDWEDILRRYDKLYFGRYTSNMWSPTGIARGLLLPG